ncbi:MAG TPA: tRNA adenosine(34) deaminase TadA [bacterium]|jgi:tRNA(adenine34) deaminase|nr:tRNA adenosine(34) deaminase TadA [bacterium]MDX9805264.1 tRNA adenosine(34) deaminase TadA [bacterium]HNW15491.1 tRNA adenosine(34) deaminase TadA [bacterium]HNZ53556.1 tRNA adenosine(34) deaminase TadA [bacterium]HPM46197.1 tRNA adenosine(34) deaminase TadA [bacterium]
MEREISYMKQALELAETAGSQGEVPVGAVVVFENRVIGKGYNRRESTNSPLSHAEIEAIMEASENMGSWRLEDCELFVTLEPCIMCSGAILQSRIKRVVFGPRDPKAGAVRSLYNLLEDTRLNHRVEVVEGVLADECSQILTSFFKEIRERQKKYASKSRPENSDDI